MWVMHSQITRRPWELRFYIGSIQVAKIFFIHRRPVLTTWGDRDYGPFNSVSEAMSAMHKLLDSPPLEIIEREAPDAPSED